MKQSNPPPASSPPPPRPPVVIVCPGNGCTDIRNSNWYGWLAEELEKRQIPCLCEDFPDPHRARRKIWVPHIRKLAERRHSNSGGDGKGESDDGGGDGAEKDNVVLVGHSSGAQAALRYAELHRCRAAVLVSATYGDLGDAGERASGYYPSSPGDGSSSEKNPYDFAAMKRNCPAWYQFHSDDDPFIPLREAERIRDGLGLQDDDDGNGCYRVLPGRSHFFQPPFPELLEVIEKLVLR